MKNTRSAKRPYLAALAPCASSVSPHAESEVGTSTPRRRALALRNTIAMVAATFMWPLYVDELRGYLAAQYGISVAASRLERLVAGDVQAVHERMGSADGLCYCLTSAHFDPILRLVALASWPLEWRLVAPTTPRVQHLKITVAHCTLALNADAVATDPTALRFLAADHARGLPGVVVRRGEFDLESWRDIALAVLAPLEPHDAELRQEAADRLRSRPEISQFFGTVGPDSDAGSQVIEEGDL